MGLRDRALIGRSASWPYSFARLGAVLQICQANSITAHIFETKKPILEFRCSRSVSNAAVFPDKAP